MFSLIEKIVKAEYANEEKKLKAIIDLLASSDETTDEFLKAMQASRKKKFNSLTDLVTDLNAELSRALVTLEKRVDIDPAWVASQIKKFYKENEIKCNFKIQENE